MEWLQRLSILLSLACFPSVAAEPRYSPTVCEWLEIYMKAHHAFPTTQRNQLVIMYSCKKNVFDIGIYYSKKTTAAFLDGMAKDYEGKLKKYLKSRDWQKKIRVRVRKELADAIVDGRTFVHHTH